VSRVEGDYFAVMGLPLHRTVSLIESLGIAYRFGSLRAGARR
jgi:predicted house-cleaning NTP pyrophosphatase (Maf/HAM1 superfamily)